MCFQLEIFLFLNHPPISAQEKTFSSVSFLSRWYPSLTCACVWSSSESPVFSSHYLHPVLPVSSQIHPFLFFSSATHPEPSYGVSHLDSRGISVSWPGSQHPLLLSSSLLTLSRCVLFKGEAYLVVMLFYQNWPPTVLTRKTKILPRPCVVCLCLPHASVTSSPGQCYSHAGFLPGPQIQQLHSNRRPSETAFCVWTDSPPPLAFLA